MRIFGILRFLTFYTFLNFFTNSKIFNNCKLLDNSKLFANCKLIQNKTNLKNCKIKSFGFINPSKHTINSSVNSVNSVNSSVNSVNSVNPVNLLGNEWSDYRVVDLCVIKVSGGDGGDGCMSFRREKHVPLGGANGGNGGPGGDVYIECNDSVSDLRWFKANKIYKAQNGNNGKGSNRNGAKGKDMYLYVPRGTVVSDSNVHTTLHRNGDKVRVARGGRGGKGNKHFITKFNVVPRICERGEEGIKRVVKLIYKKISDIALIGKPNSGKSSVIRRLTNARPRVANFPFSTRFPIHGILNQTQHETNQVDKVDSAENVEQETEEPDDEFDSCGYDTEEEIDDSDEQIDVTDEEIDDSDEEIEVSDPVDRISLVDVPGLIDGSSEGKGLGHDFLRQIEHSKTLSYVIDSSNQDPLGDYLSVRRELELYNPEILEKDEIILLNKIDLIDNQTIFKLINTFLKHTNHDHIYFLSAKTGENMDFINTLFQKLYSSHTTHTTHSTTDSIDGGDTVRKFEDVDDFRKLDRKKFTVTCESDGAFRISSPYLERKIKMMRFDLPETMDKLKSILKANKVNKKLIKLGLKEGGIIHIGDLAFTAQSNNFFQ